MTSIKAVADAAGVSIATVSRVLNGTKYVSPDMCIRVLEAVKTLNYEPSVQARSLRGKQTYSIGVSLPHLNDAFFGSLAYSIQKTLFAYGYSALFCSTEENQDKERTIINLLIRNRVDGVILVPVVPIIRALENIQFLSQQGIPIVLVDRGASALKVNQVLCNNYQGGYDAAQHLIGLGHQTIGVIGSGVEGTLYKTGPGTERFNGLLQAFHDSDRQFEAGYLGTAAQNTAESGYQAALTFLKRTPQVTALFAVADMLAVGVLRAVYELGVNVPHDLSLIGFDDIPRAPHLIPRLTTIGQPIEGIAQTAARLLLGQIQDSNSPTETILLNPQLALILILIVRRVLTQPEGSIRRRMAFSATRQSEERALPPRGYHAMVRGRGSNARGAPLLALQGLG